MRGTPRTDCAAVGMLRSGKATTALQELMGVRGSEASAWAVECRSVEIRRQAGRAVVACYTPPFSAGQPMLTRG